MAFRIQSKSDFEQLFRQHFAPLVGYASKMLPQEGQAEDVVQQLFLGIWEKRGEWEVEGSVQSYLLRSTHNLCLNQLKHGKVRQEHADHVMHNSNEGDFSDHLEHAELEAKVRSRIKQLPDQCRKIFLMNRLQGKKYREIAEELDLSVKTIENQMGKALRLLREDLQSEWSDALRVVKTILWLVVGVNAFSVVMK